MLMLMLMLCWWSWDGHSKGVSARVIGGREGGMEME
jgi:hypothetical protein